MAHDMLSELRQSRPFALPEEELHLSLVRTADLLSRAFCSLLKERGVSLPQYNVLRILRGAGEAGLPCGEVGSRMVTRDPDVTRLLDRLEQRGLITRGRANGDRRVVWARITGEGLTLLDEVDPLSQDLHREQLGFLDPGEVAFLLDQLTRIREHIQPEGAGEEQDAQGEDAEASA